MAGRLDDNLRPGERVVYQTRPDHAFVWLVFTLFAGLVVGWGLFIGVTDLAFDRVSWLFSVLFLTMLSWLVHAWLASAAALVTEHRLLYDRGPLASLWGRQRVHDIPHGEIAEIRGTGGGLGDAFELRLADGRELLLGNIADKRRLAEALSAASGTPISRPSGRASCGS